MRFNWRWAANSFIGGVLTGFGIVVLAMLLFACGGAETVDPICVGAGCFNVHTSTITGSEPVKCSECDRYGDLKDVCLERCAPD